MKSPSPSDPFSDFRTQNPQEDREDERENNRLIGVYPGYNAKIFEQQLHVVEDEWVDDEQEGELQKTTN